MYYSSFAGSRNSFFLRPSNFPCLFSHPRVSNRDKRAGRGKRIPSLTTIIQLATGLSVPPSEIIRRGLREKSLVESFCSNLHLLNKVEMNIRFHHMHLVTPQTDTTVICRAILTAAVLVFSHLSTSFAEVQEKKEPVRSLQYYQELAEKGDLEAQAELSSIYLEGRRGRIAKL